MSTGSSQRPMRAIIALLRPYKARLIAACVALVFTAGATLALGKGLQVLIDAGFGSGDPAALGNAVRFVILIGAAIALGTFVLFYLVSWLGERVSADLRSAVFRNIVRRIGYYDPEDGSGLQEASPYLSSKLPFTLPSI